MQKIDERVVARKRANLHPGEPGTAGAPEASEVRRQPVRLSVRSAPSDGLLLQLRFIRRE